VDSPPTYEAVLFDLGGVVFDGPLARFTDYERSAGLPAGLIRRINSTDPDTNAWARAERGELTPEQFLAEFAADARAMGHEIDPVAVADALYGDVYPQMVQALRGLRQAGLRLAAVTNNMSPLASAPVELRTVLELFDVTVESSVEGVRKPEEAFYRLALERLGVPAQRCVYLDDLGINLKPARAMGMTTIKVVDVDQALTELSRLLSDVPSVE
jgi:putative hydrolase of the HAD superfamily